MLQIYPSSTVEALSVAKDISEDRLSSRGAVLAIIGLALAGWAPILLPLIAILHR